MKEWALTINLKDDPQLIEKYKEYHRNVWPEVLRSLKEVGIVDMKIWLLGRRMFMLMTVVDNFDPNVDFPRYLKLDPKCQEWEDLMGTFQEKVPEAKPDEKWALMEMVFKF
jgi:L-rhamnose mutarotase